VHFQRRLQTWIHHRSYQERYKFIPLIQISPDLQHAVIAAEDVRFYHHHGFDWHETQIAAEDDLAGDRTRGASTLTQQLVKNLFFGTGRSILRKAAEFTLVPVAEFVLGKRRILENLPQRGRMGPWYLWCRVGVPVLRQNPGPECRQRTGSTASRDSACSPETTAGAHEELQRDHLKPNAPSGLVIVCQRSVLFRSQKVSRRLFFRQPINPTAENRIIKSSQQMTR
jgi:hypothetical protein